MDLVDLKPSDSRNSSETCGGIFCCSRNCNAYWTIKKMIDCIREGISVKRINASYPKTKLNVERNHGSRKSFTYYSGIVMNNYKFLLSFLSFMCLRQSYDSPSKQQKQSYQGVASCVCSEEGQRQHYDTNWGYIFNDLYIDLTFLIVKILEHIFLWSAI